MLPKSFHSLLLVGLVATLEPHLSFAQGGASTTLSIEEERRRTLYQQGKEAIKAQHWADAKSRLTDAWTIRPSYDVALSLSQAEFNLEQYDESARHLAYYFKNVSAKENENNLANAKQAFEAVKAKVGAVEVTAPRGADILVDGKLIGTAPLEANTFVKPGKRIVEARLGQAKAQQELQAVAGQEQQVALKFEEPAKPAPAAAASPVTPVDAGLPESPSVPPPQDSDGPSIVPVAIGAGIAVVGLGLGIGYRIAASSASDDLHALQQKNGLDGCRTGVAEPVDCRAAKSAGERVDNRRNVSTASFVVAGAALVGTAVYWLWPRSSRKEAVHRKLNFGGAPTPQGGSVFLLGSF